MKKGFFEGNDFLNRVLKYECLEIGNVLYRGNNVFRGFNVGF